MAGSLCFSADCTSDLRWRHVTPSLVAMMPAVPSLLARASTLSKSSGPDTRATETVIPSSRPAASISCRVSGSGLGREATTANRVAEGCASCNSWTYFWPSPGTTLVSPVTLPPGRERLATNPCATGSGTTVMTIGIKTSGTLRGDRLARPSGDDGVDLRVDQLGNETRQTLWIAIREGRPDDKIPALDIAQLAHRLDKWLPGNSPCRIRPDAQETHVMHLPGRLRPGGERRGDEGARQVADEHPPVHHSIT